MSTKEKDLYEPVRAALERSFAAIGRTTVSETGATKGLGEPLKALIPPNLEILFRFLNRKPDIVGYAESKHGNQIFTAEVKRGSLTIQDIYQAKMYKELFGATFGFLIGTQPVPEELKRLLRNIPIILLSAGDYTFHFLALARFDLDTGTFSDWFQNYPQDTDPFTHLKKLSF
jgi:hypothetical protein